MAVRGGGAWPPAVEGLYTDSMRRLAKFSCADCGELTTRYRSGGTPLVCLACGVARAVGAAQRMNERQGLQFERFLRNRHGYTDDEIECYRRTGRLRKG